MLYQGTGETIRERCRTAELLWPTSRVLAGVCWAWNSDRQCYETFQYTRDSRRDDVRQWNAGNPLSSLLRAVREDERLDDPVIRLLALYITAEYLIGALEK